MSRPDTVLRNHAQSLFQEYSDTEKERRELLCQASTLLHEADPSLTPSNQKRTFFHSQYWHSRIHDIPEDTFIFELHHHLEANGRIRLSDEHTRVSLLSLLALYPSLDTPAKFFEFSNLRTGYTLILPRSYESSDSAPSIDAPTPPLRTKAVQSTEERLIDRSGRFDDWAAHLEATLDLGNFKKARKLRLMRPKLYGEAAEQFDNFKLDNPIRAQEYSAVKERLLNAAATLPKQDPSGARNSTT
ncbi:hypothetical protein OUZ56_012724 [Daphnia magna]|uniref:Uncharacterized protein n=1 Tax=Daphnia magna TaxID=35525 RepID=A0ABQ9Z3V3_9CRUS|nr:hypothetical protein OUZ56_012724 [Daphnia magna]